ncbi:MAG TPA: hypothetical protein PLP75_01545 [Burkholderiales bacterium]|nr:hypothetical protein [Burkholderiales bacterium]
MVNIENHEMATVLQYDVTVEVAFNNCNKTITFLNTAVFCGGRPEWQRFLVELGSGAEKSVMSLKFIDEAQAINFYNKLLQIFNNW